MANPITMVNPLEPLGGEEHLKLMLGVEEFEYGTFVPWSYVCRFCMFTYKEKRIRVTIFSTGRWSLYVNNISVANWPIEARSEIRSAFETELNCTLSF
jgi:hypothetical protein